MLLRDAAYLAHELRSLYYSGLKNRAHGATTFYSMVELMQECLGEDKHIEEFDYLLDILYPKHSRYPERFVDVPYIRLNVCREIAISPIVWDEVLRGKPLVPALAEESPEAGGLGWSVKEAINRMNVITDRSVLKTCMKMSEIEARLFWSRALGEKPCIPIDKFLQIASNAMRNGKSIRAIRHLLTQLTPAQIFASLFSTDPLFESLEEKLGTIQPGVPFNGPVFHAWSKATMPSGTYLSIVKGIRRYLHITEFPKGEFRGTLYTRDRRAVRKYKAHELPFDTLQEMVVEVEVENDLIKKLTDVFAVGQDWVVFERPYRERTELLKTLTSQVPVEEAHIIEEGADASFVFDKLEDGERARLVSHGPITMGESGGWILLQKAFHLHLLVSQMKRDRDYATHIQLSVMDGFEPFEVFKAKLDPEMAHHFRERMAREGMLAGPYWTPVEEHALIYVVEVQAVGNDQLSIEEAELIHLDDNLGLSDTSQLTDLIELVAYNLETRGYDQ
jgi:hypothetical protein